MPSVAVHRIIALAAKRRQNAAHGASRGEASPPRPIKLRRSERNLSQEYVAFLQKNKIEYDERYIWS
jgi:hypothetical protein